MSNVIFVYYVCNIFLGLVNEYYTFIRHYLETKSISQPHLLAGSQFHISKVPFCNNFLVYSPICMRFALNSLVLKYFLFDYIFAWGL